MNTRPLLAFGVTLFMLVLVWMDTNLARDRTIFVSPPHARAENFVRALAAHRAELVVDDLAPDARRHVAASDLQEWFNAIDRQVGGTWQVEAETLSHDKERATVRVELSGDSGRTVALELRFAWLHGKWIVQELPPVPSKTIRYTR